MKIRTTTLIAVLALILVLPLTAWADPCPFSTDGTHAWGEWTEYPATCGTDGWRERTCPNCKATETEIMSPATGEHVWGEWHYATAAPSCTEPGTQIRICQNCGQSETRDVPPIDHQYGDWTILQEPTCTTEGARVRYCQNCQNPEKEAIPATGHAWGEWSVTLEPTCTAEGIRARYCQVCQEQATEAIPAKGHTPETIPAVKATCTTDGSTEGSRCSVCGAVLAEPTVIPASGHKWGEWQEVASGKKERKCEWCGEKQQKLLEEAGLSLTAEKIARQDPADSYSDVYAVDMKLENTGTIPLQLKVYATYGDGDPGEFAEVITDEIVGLDYYNPGTIQPGETISFQYVTRTNGMYTDGEKRVITRLVSAQGTSENPDARVTAVQPIVINLPAEDGLLLTVENMHRSGTGTDEVITFDLKVTNQVTGWSLVSVSAKDYMGQQRDGDEFSGWPEEGLLLGYGRSHSFSFSFRPSAGELEKVTENNPLAWIGRYVTVQDLQGHTAEVVVTAKLQTPQTAEALLDGEMEKLDLLCANESASIPVSLTLRNIGDIPITNPVVKGVLMTDGGKTLRSYTLTPKNGVSVLQPQESATFILTAPVGPEDESATLEDEEHLLRFAFYAEYEFEDPEKGTARGESNIWHQEIPVSELTAEDPRSSYIAPVLTVSFEDKVYKPGEKVMFNLKVENVNPEDTIEGIRFEWFPVDESGEMGEPLTYEYPDIILKPGESYELTNKFYYSIGEEEAAQGVYILDFVAWCYSPAYDWYSNSEWYGMILMKAN